MSYPRPITQLHQVEVTTFCNLRCVYCPSPKLHTAKYRNQPRQHMSMEVWERALEWCKALPQQGELSITGIGETLLHPQWKQIIATAREALPENFLNFSTNGLLLDDDACAHLAEHRVGVFVSQHRPEKAGPALERAKRHGILVGTNSSASLDAMDWAGQVDWYVSDSAEGVECTWLKEGWGNVLVDGRITTCCLDASAKGVVGDVWAEPGSLSMSPWSLCDDCHQVPPLPGELPMAVAT